MEKRTVGIIATIATVLLCGCPGLGSLCWGTIALLAGAKVPGFTVDVGGSSDPTTAMITGLATCCFGIIFIIIPIAVGFFTLRKQAEAPMAADQPPSSGM